METDHPDFFFDKLAETNIAYGYQLDKARQISEIMAKSPKIYTNTLAYTGSLVVVSNEVLTLDHLQSALNKFWRIEHGDYYDSDSESEDGDDAAEIMSALIRQESMINEVKNVLSVGKWGTSQESVDQEGAILIKITDTKDPETIKGNLEKSVIIVAKWDTRIKIASPKIKQKSELHYWIEVKMNLMRKVSLNI